MWVENESAIIGSFGSVKVLRLTGLKVRILQLNKITVQSNGLLLRVWIPVHGLHGDHAIDL